jgi:hypothetical protein
MDQTNKYIIIKVAADAVPCLCVYLLNTRTHAGMLLTNWFPFSACDRARERLSILTRFFNVFFLQFERKTLSPARRIRDIFIVTT